MMSEQSLIDNDLIIQPIPIQPEGVYHIEKIPTKEELQTNINYPASFIQLKLEEWMKHNEAKMITHDESNFYFLTAKPEQMNALLSAYRAAIHEMKPCINLKIKHTQGLTGKQIATVLSIHCEVVGVKVIPANNRSSFGKIAYARVRQRNQVRIPANIPIRMGATTTQTLIISLAAKRQPQGGPTKKRKTGNGSPRGDNDQERCIRFYRGSCSDESCVRAHIKLQPTPPGQVACDQFVSKARCDKGDSCKDFHPKPTIVVQTPASQAEIKAARPDELQRARSETERVKRKALAEQQQMRQNMEHFVAGIQQRSDEHVTQVQHECEQRLALMETTLVKTKQALARAESKTRDRHNTRSASRSPEKCRSRSGSEPSDQSRSRSRTNSRTRRRITDNNDTQGAGTTSRPNNG